MKYILLGCILLLGIGCTTNNPDLKAPSIGDQSIQVFEGQKLYFDMAFKNDTLSESSTQVLHLDAGRVLFKKVLLPDYERDASITLNMSLTSNGDPWDKSGSVFILPKSSSPSFIQLENGDSLPSFSDSTSYPATVPEMNFKPALELLRFMTPFGIGYYSDTLNEYRPSYIPEWEKEINWQTDLTHLRSELKGEVWIGVFIDTWSSDGYLFDIELVYDESEYSEAIAPKTVVIPVANTVKYLGNQKLYDAFSKNDLNVSVPFLHPKDSVLEPTLYLTTSGHGGHATGDEFTKRPHTLTLNGTEAKQWTPWRKDCASFRRFNPSSGVWTEKVFWQGDSIDERIASSDYSRSNWCPGSMVEPVLVPIAQSNAAVDFNLHIEGAQAIENDLYNYWMVSAYVVYELPQKTVEERN